VKRTTLSERALVLAPRGRDAAIAVSMLAEAGMLAQACASLPLLLYELDQGAAFAIVTEEALSTADVASLAAWIAEQQEWSDLPFILLTNQGGGLEKNPSARRYLSLLGNVTFLERPFHPTTLVSVALAALRGRRRQYEARARLEALRDSEARFEAIANSIDQMVWSTTADGYHDYYNDRWYEFTGVPKGSTDGDAWNDMFHPEDQEKAWSMWRRCLASGEPYQIEYRLRHASGDYRWVLGRAQCVRDARGQITRWFGTCTDIQDIIEAREVLARSGQELEHLIAERTAERNRVWEMSRDLFAVMSFDGYLKEINPAWTTTLGVDEATLLKRPFPEQVHPEDHQAVRETVERLRRGETVAKFEDRLRHADGSWRWIAWGLVPGGDVFYAVGRDVTAEKQRQAALDEAQEQLRQAQKMEAVGQLTGGVAHDFNNLLTIIKSSTDLLRNPDLTEERRSRYVDAISNTVDRASKLTGQLLAFARRQALKPEVFDVAERLPALIDMLRPILGTRVQIVSEIASENCFIETDINQFETAIVNMAVNARDAMDGEGTLTITVEELAGHLTGSRQGRGKFVAISLSDTGTGVSIADLAHIFEPFYTTKEVGKGTGLGLSQVYGFAKQSGGDITVENKPSRGARFTLYLPRVEGRRSEAVAADAPRARSDTGFGRRVLVVEDNVEVGTFSTQLLRDLGYETTWAANAEEALKVLEEVSGFEVIFSDIVMPGMSGIELGKEIRRRYPSLPVVLTSGYSNVLAEDGRQGFELLQKPYAVEDLSRVLRSAIGRQYAGADKASG
jgi:PAS domain S-box-containing protein